MMIHTVSDAPITSQCRDRAVAMARDCISVGFVMPASNKAVATKSGTPGALHSLTSELGPRFLFFFLSLTARGATTRAGRAKRRHKLAPSIEHVGGRDSQ